MRNYIILNDQNSNDISGLLIQSLAPISKPLMRTEIEEIDGRDGDIVTPLGFSAYDKQITIGLYGTYDINAIIAFFNSEGTVTFSNEPDKYYNYQIYDQIDFERLVRFKTATVTLHCQPFKFATTGESQTLSGGDPISAEGTNLVLEGSALAPFSQFDLKGNTEQQTYSGKNLLNFVPRSTAQQGLTTTYDSETGAIHVSGTTTATYSNISERVYEELPAGTYTFSVSSSQSQMNINLRTYDTDGNYTNRSINTGSTSTTFTVSKAITSYYAYVWNNSWSSTSINSTFTLQLESGSTASSFEPYVGGVPAPNPDYPQAVKVVTGENVVKITDGQGAEQSYEVNLSAPNLYDKTQAVKSGGSNQNVSFTTSVDTNTHYIFDCGTRTWVTAYLYNSSDTQTRIIGGTSDSHRVGFTTTSAEVKVQLVFYVGADVPLPSVDFSMVNFYKPSDAIELCKIGTYQDYIYKSEDKWYKHKAIGKKQLTGSETWAFSANGNAWYVSNWANTNRAVIPASSDSVAPVLCADFTPVARNNLVDVSSGFGIANSAALNMKHPDYTTSSSDFAGWVTANQPTVYFALQSNYVVDEEITNATLIEQLNDIADQAHAYKTRTYVGSTYADGNVPFIIAATVVGDASGTVINSGNIYSKPKLTVYGSGDIGIYLNGVQMFQIALGDSGYITIDTNLMEAYQDNLETLMNRQVTGDYSNFKLPVGQSTISFSGVVTSCVVENFSRWL